MRVSLAGDLDYSSTHLLEPLAAQVLLLGPLVVQIDLRRLWFCDIAGVRQIVNLHQSWHKQGLSVSLHGARPPVRLVFNLAGQADVLRNAWDLRGTLARKSRSVGVRLRSV